MPPNPTTAPSHRPNRWLAPALWANAIAIALLAYALLTRSDASNLRWPSFLPAALAQSPGGNIAGGGGVYIMPAQLSPKAWGTYLLDIDAQTLLVYTYTENPRQLQLVAARSYRYDRRLQNFNTAAPSPEEVRELLEREQRRPTPPSTPPSSATPSAPPGNAVDVAPVDPK